MCKVKKEKERNLPLLSGSRQQGNPCCFLFLGGVIRSGQARKSRSCPNAGYIWTGLAGKKQKLSEYRLHSDMASPKKVEAV